MNTKKTVKEKTRFFVGNDSMEKKGLKGKRKYYKK